MAKAQLFAALLLRLLLYKLDSRDCGSRTDCNGCLRRQHGDLVGKTVTTTRGRVVLMHGSTDLILIRMLRE